MKNILILFLICLLPAIGFSQEKQNDLLNDKAYKKYEKKALELYSSTAYNAYSDSMHDFSTGLGKTDFDFGDSDFRKWLDVHFDKTDFKSKEEAVFLYERYHASATEELFNRIREVSNDGYALRLQYGAEVFDAAFQVILNKALQSKKL